MFSWASWLATSPGVALTVATIVLDRNASASGLFAWQLSASVCTCLLPLIMPTVIRANLRDRFHPAPLALALLVGLVTPLVLLLIGVPYLRGAAGGGIVTPWVWACVVFVLLSVVICVGIVTVLFFLGAECCHSSNAHASTYQWFMCSMNTFRSTA